MTPLPRIAALVATVAFLALASGCSQPLHDERTYELVAYLLQEEPAQYLTWDELPPEARHPALQEAIEKARNGTGVGIVKVAKDEQDTIKASFQAAWKSKYGADAPRAVPLLYEGLYFEISYPFSTR